MKKLLLINNNNKREMNWMNWQNQKMLYYVNLLLKSNYNEWNNIITSNELNKKKDYIINPNENEKWKRVYRMLLNILFKYNY